MGCGCGKKRLPSQKKISKEPKKATSQIGRPTRRRIIRKIGR